MKLTIRSFSIRVATAFLFGTIMCSPVSAVTQGSNENVHDAKNRATEEVKAREKLKEQGVSEEKRRAVQDGFAPKPKDTRPHKADDLDRLDSPKKDSSGKIIVKDRDTAHKPKLSGGQPELRGNSTRQPASLDQGHADQQARQKNETENGQTEKPETHHHHQHQQQPPSGECDSAGSPSAVANCKKARDELKANK